MLLVFVLSFVQPLLICVENFIMLPRSRSCTLHHTTTPYATFILGVRIHHHHHINTYTSTTKNVLLLPWDRATKNIPISIHPLLANVLQKAPLL